MAEQESAEVGSHPENTAVTPAQHQDPDTEQAKVLDLEPQTGHEAGDDGLTAQVPLLFPECTVCLRYQDRHQNSPFFLLQQNNLMRQDGSFCQSSLQDFYKHISALMNTHGGGFVLIHSAQTLPFRPFDVAVDDKINDMIADATLFHANFERVFLDYNHVIFHVKDTEGTNVSTLVFNTALLVNEQLVHPTQGNMRRLAQDCASAPPLLGAFEPPYHPDAPKVFKLKEQVHMYQGFSTHLHHADLDLIEKKDGKDVGAKALNYWWEDFELPNFISGICKLCQGGCLYLGMRPEDPVAARREQERLDEQEDSDDETKAKVRRRSSSWSSDSDSSPPPRKRLSMLTKFFCEGLKLTESERSTFQSELQWRVEEEMMWHPYYPSQEGRVANAKFHDVEGGEPDLCLVEIQVRRFYGLAFFKSTGPEAFRAVGSGKNSVIERIPFKEYITMFDFKSFY